jgi:hypothetical protein
MLTFYLCVLYGSQTTTIFLHKRLAFITEVEIVYCEVRTESLYKTDGFCLIRVNITLLVVLISHVPLCRSQVSYMPRTWCLLCGKLAAAGANTVKGVYVFYCCYPNKKHTQYREILEN